MRIEPEKGFQVVRMLCEGIGVRAIERLTGLNRRTVLGVLETAGKKCATLMDTKMRGIKSEQVGVDELFAFVYCKDHNTFAGDPERGDQYTWISMDRGTKLIISQMVGKRIPENAALFMQDLKTRMDGRFQLSTDGYLGYTGYNGAVIQTFYNTIDYGFEVKKFGMETKGPRRYSPVRCLSAKRFAQVGNPDMDFVNTSHVERANLSFRLFNRRLTRLTLGYSKKLENLRLAMAMFVAFYNFCRTHSALKVAATETQPAQQRTPAMAHGLTDHVWTVQDLLAAS